MSASELTQNQQFVQLRDAAVAVGIKLVFGEQGTYWLSHGNHATPFRDLAGVRRALVDGCGLHTLYPNLQRVVFPEPPPKVTAPAWVRDIVADAKPTRQPQSVAELKAMVDRRRAERMSSDEWWRKDQTPQNRKRAVRP